MNYFTLSWKNLWARPLNTLISLLLLVMGVSIISLLLILNSQLDDNFKKNIRGIDMVIGAKGSPLQLILASVYHIDNPTGNISLREADSVARDPLIEKTIRLAYGDNYQGYRILGTEHTYPEHYGVELAEGRLWEADFEVSIGALVAERLGLSIGDEFFGAHGLVSDMDVHDTHAYKVVGIMALSETVVDQMIMTPISSVWAIHEGHGGTPDTLSAEEKEASREITAMLIKWRTPMAMMQLPRKINENTNMQAALTAIEINRLFDLFAVGIATIRGIALAIIVISAISVFFSLYNSLKDRQYEIALMRTLGGSSVGMFFMVILEGLWLGLLGFVVGMLVSRGGLYLLSVLVEQNYRYDFSVLQFLPEEGILFLATLGIGLLAALFPALNAYATDISETLAEER